MKDSRSILMVALLALALLLGLTACSRETAPNGDVNHNGQSCAHRDADDNALCDMCGESYTDAVDVVPHTHVYGEWSVSLHATCSAKGEERRTCSCGVYEARELELYPCDADNACPACLACEAQGLVFALRPDGTYTVTDYNGSAREVTIPAVYRGVAVTFIGGFSFGDCTMLTRVTLPESITKIGTSAFRNCISLVSITIPSGMTEIYSGAFVGCSKLIEVCNLSSLNIVAGATTHGSVANHAKNLYTASQGKSKCFTDGTGYIFYDDGTDRYLMGYIGKETVLTLPESCNGNDYKLSAYAFAEREDITDVTVSAGVTVLNSSSFRNCKGLVRVCFAEGGKLTHIGNNAFANCTSLVRVDCAEQSALDTLGSAAFYGCTALESITIPSGVTQVSDNAFGYCTSLTAITIPSSVTQIGDNAFYGCKRIASVSFAEDGLLERIGNSAFQSCISLTWVRIAPGVTDIGEAAFKGCSSLESLTFAENSCLKTIAREAFQNCNLRSVIFEKNGQLESLGVSCFAGNDFSSIVIPQGVSYIGQYAFSSCEDLISVTLPQSLKTLHKQAFMDNPKLLEIYNLSSFEIVPGSSEFGHLSQHYVKNVYTPTNGQSHYFADEDGFVFYDDGTNRYLMEYTGRDRDLTLPSSCNGSSYEIHPYAFKDNDTLLSVTIPTGVTSIGMWAFFSCSNLMSVTVSQGLTDIGEMAFLSCVKLIEICNLSSLDITLGSDSFGCIAERAKKLYTEPQSEKHWFVDADGFCFFENEDERYLMGYIGQEKAVTLPESCNGDSYEIYAYAFFQNQRILSVTVSTGVTKIGPSAFDGCSLLRTVSLPAGLLSIGSYAFGSCSELVTVTIPSSVTSIGDYAFSYCTALTCAVIPDGVESLGEAAFRGCTALCEVTLGNSLQKIAPYTFAECTALTSLTVGTAVTHIADQAFRDIALREIHISDLAAWCRITCDSFDFNLMYYKIYLNGELLTAAVIPEGVTAIREDAFRGCVSITSVVIPDSVLSLGASAFYDCDDLSSVTLGNGLQTIGNSAFAHCTALTSIVIPDSVASIEQSAFNWCNGLHSIVIGKGVTSLGMGVFISSTVREIYYGGSESDWNAITGLEQNVKLLNIPRYYYSETEAAGCWHFVDGEPTLW